MLALEMASPGNQQCANCIGTPVVPRGSFIGGVSWTSTVHLSPTKPLDPPPIKNVKLSVVHTAGPIYKISYDLSYDCLLR